jgi:hypothetical protein
MLDLQALYEALDLKRQELRLSWDEVAHLLDVDVDELTGLGDGRDPHAGAALRAVHWTGLGLDHFIAEDDRRPAEPSGEKAKQVAAFLRANRDLKPESAEAIEAVLKAAYDRFAAPA